MDSTSVNTNNNNNKLQQTSLSNSSSGSAANSSSVGAASGGGAGQAGNLEAVIMQKLLKHEKKASIPGESDDAAADSAPASATSGTALNGSVLNEVGKSVSSITITKKRNFDEAIKLSESSNHLKALNGRVYEKDEGYLKKRRRQRSAIRQHNQKVDRAIARQDFQGSSI
jgi:hypothetical protein